MLEVLSLCGVVGAVASQGRGRVAAAMMFCTLVVVADATVSVLWALGNQPLLSATWAGLAVFWAWLWWRNWRKRRKRSLKALGNKAKARLAAMLRNMPRPSPRLVPQRSPA
jgi:hypothetical protein